MILKDIFNEIIPKIWPLILFITVVLVSIRLTYLLKGSKKVVIYEALYGENLKWARAYDMFASKVDKKKHPDVKQTYRFEKVD